MSDFTPRKPFAAKWVEVQHSLETFIAASGPSFHDAEDLLQKVAVIAYEKYDAYEPDRGPFLGWVMGIAKNELMHWRRSSSRDRLVFDEDTVEILASAQLERDRDTSLVGLALEWCIGRVRGRSREALELRYAEDLGPTAIAERMGTSSSSIRVTLARARHDLRACVERRMRLILEERS
ncbi:MAG: sigma-70 family RNA polymerase sigma factor [Pirellulales bacterium]|nr:sigma-70 family RNA polymerase sigma factor [Pirellulales bacterium]